MIELRTMTEEDLAHVRQAGFNCALHGRPRKSPYIRKAPQHLEWLKGYDKGRLALSDQQGGDK